MIRYYIIVWTGQDGASTYDGVMKAFTAEDAAFQFEKEFPKRRIRSIEPILLDDPRCDQGLVFRLQTRSFVWPLSEKPSYG